MVSNGSNPAGIKDAIRAGIIGQIKARAQQLGESGTANMATADINQSPGQREIKTFHGLGSLQQALQQAHTTPPRDVEQTPATSSSNGFTDPDAARAARRIGCYA
jgi:hypothetical protein